MKNRFLFVLFLLFVLTGCARSGSGEVKHPYEVARGASTLSYFDTEDDVDIDGVQIYEWDPKNLTGGNKDESYIVIKDGKIRYIFITDEDIITYHSISVGDKVDKIEDAFNKSSQLNDTYTVLFNNDTEEDPMNENKEDTWIWIMYDTDGSQITSIRIFDVLYGREFR